MKLTLILVKHNKILDNISLISTSIDFCQKHFQLSKPLLPLPLPFPVLSLSAEKLLNYLGLAPPSGYLEGSLSGDLDLDILPFTWGRFLDLGRNLDLDPLVDDSPLCT